MESSRNASRASMDQQYEKKIAVLQQTVLTEKSRRTQIKHIKKPLPFQPHFRHKAAFTAGRKQKQDNNGKFGTRYDKQDYFLTAVATWIEKTTPVRSTLDTG